MDLPCTATEGRRKSLTGVRLFTDQVQSLRRLVARKYRNNRSFAELVREALDQYIQREEDV